MCMRWGCEGNVLTLLVLWGFLFLISGWVLLGYMVWRGVLWGVQHGVGGSWKGIGLSV